uniref:Uncharacterized protein n=1 Tax=Octopus bimaculoides TaxID=37653 RepID=A0A0L8HZ80_OCTBM
MYIMSIDKLFSCLTFLFHSFLMVLSVNKFIAGSRTCKKLLSLIEKETMTSRLSSDQ